MFHSTFNVFNLHSNFKTIDTKITKGEVNVFFRAKKAENSQAATSGFFRRMLLYPKYISANLLIYLLDILMVSSDVFIKQYLAT